MWAGIGPRTVAAMRALILAVLVVVGLLAAAVAVVYFVLPVHSLPSFFPGHARVGHGIRYRRGAVAAVVAAVLLVIALVVGLTGRRRVAVR